MSAVHFPKSPHWHLSSQHSFQKSYDAFFTLSFTQLLPFISYYCWSSLIFWDSLILWSRTIHILYFIDNDKKDAELVHKTWNHSSALIHPHLTLKKHWRRDLLSQWILEHPIVPYQVPMNWERYQWSIKKYRSIERGRKGSAIHRLSQLMFRS